MRRLVLVVALLALGGCVGPRESSSNRPGAALMSKQWLIGGWVIEGESCDSDAGVIYGRDGEWIADGASGKWQLKSGRLITTIVAQENENGALISLDPPIRKSEPIERATPDAYSVRAGDGTIRRLKRCPA